MTHISGKGVVLLGVAAGLSAGAWARSSEAASRSDESSEPAREAARPPKQESSAPEGRQGRQSPRGVNASPSGQARRRVARVLRPKEPCLNAAIDVERGFGGEVRPVVLTQCDGRPAPRAVEELSILVRPTNAPKPTALAVAPSKNSRGAVRREAPPGGKLVPDGLVTRLQQVIDHFKSKKITIVSGYRPASLGSFHQSARAIDLRVSGVGNEALVAFCRTLDDTGCGYYPNSSFVHLDVRAPGAGHVYWIDASGPGEPARYVASWPPREAPGAEPGLSAADAPFEERSRPAPLSPLPGGGGGLAGLGGRAQTALPYGDGSDPFRP